MTSNPRLLFPREQPALAHPAIDLVLLTVSDGGLQVVVRERERPPFEGRWTLPGRLIEEPAAFELAMHEVLYEEIGDLDAALRPFFTFSDPARDPRGWVISTAFVALVRPAWLARVTEAGLGPVLADVTMDEARKEARVMTGGVALPLAFDHGAIIDAAVRHLRGVIDGTMIAFDALDYAFTMLELQTVHESVLGKPLSKPLFRKRMLARTFPDGRSLQTTGDEHRGSGRPAAFYTLA
ncbi:hypothetical protein [uncultured Croceicoccus sp.]|uniref:NUDIX hydrolase n=1 Tax=uncultured Croceicoccus sp. TaxID=1295329 RepID=UPI0026284D06|nr:hypothetical protein [uncultured Croceicoccus sp.]